MQNKHFNFEEVAEFKTLFNKLIEEISEKNDGVMPEDMEMAIIIMFVHRTVDEISNTKQITSEEKEEIKKYLTVILFECIANA